MKPNYTALVIVRQHIYVYADGTPIPAHLYPDETKRMLDGFLPPAQQKYMYVTVERNAGPVSARTQADLQDKVWAKALNEQLGGNIVLHYTVYRGVSCAPVVNS